MSTRYERLKTEDEEIERYWFSPLRDFKQQRDLWIAEHKTASSVSMHEVIEAAKSFASGVKIVLKCEIFEQSGKSGGWSAARLPRIGKLTQLYRRGYFPTLLQRVVIAREICEPLSHFYDTSKHIQYDTSMMLFSLLQTMDCPRIVMLIGKEQAWQHTLQELAKMVALFIEAPPIALDSNLKIAGTIGNPKSVTETIANVDWWCRLIFWLIIEDRAFLNKINGFASRESARAFVYQRFAGETLASLQGLYLDLESRFSDYCPSPTWVAWMRVVLGSTFMDLYEQMVDRYAAKE